MEPLKIFIVDDSREFLRGVENLLATCPGVMIAGTAGSGREAVERAAALKPDLVLMDVAMPGMNGLEATKLIKARPGAPAVVILTLYDTIEHRCLAAAAGADGFIPKADFGAYVYDLLDAISGAQKPLAELIRGAEKTGADTLAGGASDNGGREICPR